MSDKSDNDNIDYREVLDRVHKRRSQENNPKNDDNKNRRILAGVAAAVAAVVVVAGIAVGVNSSRKASEEEEAVALAQAMEEQAEAEAVSEEERLREEEAAAKQAVVDSYQNLGFVETSGYLNVRSTPDNSDDLNIIGKLQQNSACEIIDTEGDWFHITSGGLDGYVSSQYVLIGEEARDAAIENVSRMAIISADKLNIRSEPEIDPTNVVAQALSGERYTILEEVDPDWYLIEEGYISADPEYSYQTYALNEARKLDLREMALNQYDNLVISKVSDYLNIRSSPELDGDNNIIGKLPGRAAGDIVETEEGWYKIKSGNIVGYISSDPQYVAVGEEARDLALESADLMAIVQTEGLRVRTEPTTESTIWTVISKDERYDVVSQLDGWVQIELDTGDNDETDQAFISTRDNNVEVRYALKEAIKFSPLQEKADRITSLRNTVVNYALRFVGGKYVWGGTDPNTGADCSGFVQYVYRNAAGISLPRVSRDQAKTGRAVSSSDLQPADLIFYTNGSGTVNHVAMYIGNGQIVHAASRKSGIKIATWNYRTPKTIRRFIE